MSSTSCWRSTSANCGSSWSTTSSRARGDSSAPHTRVPTGLRVMTSLPAGAISTAWPSTTSLVTPGARRTIMRRRLYAPARAADEAKVRRAGRLEAAMQQEGGDRAGQEGQIRAQGHPGDVVEVEGRRFVHEDLVAVRDLPGAREPRLDGVAGVLPGGVAGDDLGQLGTGPHEAHLAPADVDQLGELVEAEGPW